MISFEENLFVNPKDDWDLGKKINLYIIYEYIGERSLNSVLIGVSELSELTAGGLASSRRRRRIASDE